jgi:hypothetical protein
MRGIAGMHQGQASEFGPVPCPLAGVARRCLAPEKFSRNLSGHSTRHVALPRNRASKVALQLH